MTILFDTDSYDFWGNKTVFVIPQLSPTFFSSEAIIDEVAILLDNS